MKIINNIKFVITIFSIALFLSACGSGDAEFSGTSTTVSIVDCNSSVDVADYSALQSGDVIVKDEDNTSISTYHDIDGNKRVCVDNGSAHIVR